MHVEMWYHLDDNKCPCSGNGWAFFKEWETCKIHYQGQLHPDSIQLLLDDNLKLKEEQRKSKLIWMIDSKKQECEKIRASLFSLEKEIFLLEKELINKTPTVKMTIKNNE